MTRADENERLLIGALIIEPRLLHEIAGTIQPEDFASQQRGAIFRAITTLVDAGKDPDPVQLARAAGLDEDAKRDLSAMTDGVPKMRSLAPYAALIRRRGTIRRTLIAMGKIAQDMTAELKQEGEAGAFEDKLTKLAVAAGGRVRSRRRSTFREGAAAAAEFLDDFELPQSRQAVLTGLGALDWRLGGGLRRGRLYTFAAATGEGKSSFVTQVAHHASSVQGLNALIFSLEMEDVELYVREIERRSGASKWDRRRKATRDLARDRHLAAINDMLKEKQPTVVWEPMLTVDQIRRECMAEKLERGGVLDLVVVDYAQIVAPSADAKKDQPRYLQVRTIAEGLRALAQEIGAAVLVSAQLNPPEKGKPNLTHVRESKDLANTSDAVILAWHEWTEEDGHRYPSNSELIITKLRLGSPGTIEVRWSPKTYSFESVHASEP